MRKYKLVSFFFSFALKEIDYKLEEKLKSNNVTIFQ